MISVLLTRPRPASEHLARELAAQGYNGVIEPLLVIEPLSTPRPLLTNVQAVMITSQNALDAGQGFEALFAIPCFCIGAQTAMKAREAGFRSVQSTAGDGAVLAHAVASYLGNKNQPILHISGRDVDSRAQDTLEKLGYAVINWPVYAANSVQDLTQSTVDLLQQGKLDAILVFSARTAQVLASLLTRHGLEACCERLTAIGISDAVTDILQALPWKMLVAAAVPTEDAMIDRLKDFHPVC